MIRQIFIFITILCGFPFYVHAAQYSNYSAQIDGNYIVFYYDLLTQNNKQAVVGLQIRTKKRIYTTRSLHLSGDVGLVNSGKNRKIYWDVSKDFPNGTPKDAKWSLRVRDRNYKNVFGMEFVYIPKGCYLMGADKDDAYAKKDEKPQHKVCVDGFFIGRYEVTNKQFKLFDPTHNSGVNKQYDLSKDNYPVINVSWDNIHKYTKWLYVQTKEMYRLPTEAEWEYAARAGIKEDVYWDKEQDACKYGNFYDLDSNKKIDSSFQKPFNCHDGYVGTAPVGKFLPNRFGLYDMLGNAAEWCYDTYYAKAYSISKLNNPVYINPQVSLAKSVRGGNWYSPKKYARLSARSNYMPGLITDFIGFRLVLEP